MCRSQNTFILKTLFCKICEETRWRFTGPVQLPVPGKPRITAEGNGDYIRYSGYTLQAPLKIQILGCFKESVILRVEPTDQVKDSFPSAAQVKPK